MVEDEKHGARPGEEEPVEQVHDEIAARNDETTEREAFEQEMSDEGRSEEARHVGDHIE